MSIHIICFSWEIRKENINLICPHIWSYAFKQNNGWYACSCQHTLCKCVIWNLSFAFSVCNFSSSGEIIPLAISFCGSWSISISASRWAISASWKFNRLTGAGSQINSILLLIYIQSPSWKHACIILTPETPLLNSKTGVYKGICFCLISAQNEDWGYLLEPPHWGSSNKYPQSMFGAEIWKISEFFIWKFSFFGGKIFGKILIGMFS